MVNPIKSGSGGWKFFNKIQIFFAIVFIGIIIFQAVLMSVEQHNIEVGLKYVGNKLISTTQHIQALSQEIIKNQGVYSKEDDFVHQSWSVIKISYDLFQSLYLIYLWLWILKYIWEWIIGDTSLKRLAYFLAAITFIVIQMFTILLNGGDWMTPLLAFRDLFNAGKFLISPISAYSDKVI